MILLKKIAVYGVYVAKVPVRQRYWKRRKDGIKQRYCKKTKRMKKVVMSGRYEFHGKGRDLYRAIMKALTIVPKGYIIVSAEKFLSRPMIYGYEGKWIDREVESG